MGTMIKRGIIILKNNNQKINSISRAIDLLNLYDSHTKELGISEIARNLKLNKSTVFRIVNTLKYKQVLKKNPDNDKYYLGLQLYKLGVLAREQNSLVDLMSPFLESLMKKSNETSSLIVLDGNMCMFIAEKETEASIRMFAREGSREFPHCCAGGKILLLEKSKEDISEMIRINGLPIFTEKTINTEKQLTEELQEVQRLGYSLDNEEREEGVMCIAAPIKDKDQKIIAALSISGPKYRFEGETKFNELVNVVKEEALKASVVLGYAS